MSIEETAEVETPEAETTAPEVVEEATAAPDTGDTSEGTTTESTDVEDLLSPTEMDALKDDPAALRKALLRSYHEKTTKVKQQRVEAETALKFAQWVQEDPERALEAMAAKLGRTLPKDPSKQQAEQVAKATKAALMTQMTEAVGEDAARQLLPAMEALVNASLSEALKPVQQFHQQQVITIANERAQSAVETFKGDHPDFPKFESAMLELGKKMKPSEGMTDLEWMENLYLIAKAKSGTATAEAAARMSKSAEAMRSPVKGQSTKDVSTPNERPSIKEAFAMAQRGVRV